MGETRRRGAEDAFDVAVVGGRVAGAAAALLLARAGHRVVVLERVRLPSDTLSTHLILPAGIVHLGRWGVLDDIVGAGTPALRSISVDVDGVALSMPVWEESGVAALYAPRRTVLDPVLLDAAERAGAVVRLGVTVEGLRRDHHGRVVGVVGRDAARQRFHVTARVVVGADGWRSLVAREAGAVAYETHPATNASHYAYWSGIENRGVELWYRTTGLMAGVFPTNGGACVWVNCPTARAPELRADRGHGYLDFLAAAAPDLVPRLARAERISPVRGTAGLSGCLRTPSGAGWVLAGDAGCTTDPCGGHGITGALKDSELAAIATDAMLREPSVEDEAMRAFHAARDRSSRPLYEISRDMAAYGWTATDLFDLHTRFAAELVAEARAAAGTPAWAGVP